MRQIKRASFLVCLFFLFWLLVLVGCGSSGGSGDEEAGGATTTTTATSTTTTTQALPDLRIESFSADEDYFTIRITNEGNAYAGNIEVKYWLDSIYMNYPESRLVTVEGMYPGTAVAFVVLNTLTPEWEKAGHCVSVEVDYDDDIEESDESDNVASATYYDGDYPEIYTSVSSSVATWREIAKQRCQDYFGFPATVDYSLQLVDSLTYEGGTAYGLMSVRYPVTHIQGYISYPTAVTFLNLEAINDGYSTYVYDGITYSANASSDVVVHEYVHAYHWEYVYSDQGGSWNNVPRWLREGLAVYGAHQGEDRVKNTMAVHMTSGYNTVDTTKDYLLEGLVSNDDHGAVNYAQDYMALEYIVNNYGLSTLQSILEENANGTSAETAVLNNLPDVSSWSYFENTLLYNYCAATVEAYYAYIPAFPFARHVASPLPVD